MVIPMGYGAELPELGLKSLELTLFMFKRPKQIASTYCMSVVCILFTLNLYLQYII